MKAMLTSCAVSCSLLAASAALYPSLQQNLLTAVQQTGAEIQRLRTTTLEERKIRTYGDLNRIGYGYLKRVLEGLPDPEMFPVTRYYDWSHQAQLYFPGRHYRIDDRMMVGISLSTDQVTESVLAAGARVSSATEGPAIRTAWGLMSPYQNDRFTGLRFHFKTPARRAPQTVAFGLYNAPGTGKLLGNWQIELAGGDTYDFRFPQEMPALSLMLNSPPYVLIVQNTPLIPGLPADGIESIEALGIKVDLNGYRIVQHEGGCFTAFKTDFLDELERRNQGPWKAYLEKLKAL